VCREMNSADIKLFEKSVTFHCRGDGMVTLLLIISFVLLVYRSPSMICLRMAKRPEEIARSSGASPSACRREHWYHSGGRSLVPTACRSGLSHLQQWWTEM